MRRRAAAVAVAAVIVAACAPGGATFSKSVSAVPGATGTAPGGGNGGAAEACPARYVDPDPGRPQVRLTFDLADDMATVTGTEHVELTPDLPVREVIFRLTANTVPSVREGNSVTVTSASASPGGQPFRVEPAGAGHGTQGGLLVIPLDREVAAGERVTADVSFTLRLGEQAFDRFGHTRSYAWWGSGQPLLAWERGVGWHSEPLLRFIGESATSEAARIDLTVTAPGRWTVLGSGTADLPADTGNGRRRWHAVADRARDVSVAVGDFTVREEAVDGTRVVVGTPSGRAPDELLGEMVRAVRELSRRFGPFPFPVLSVARLPIQGGGIEYPGSILMLDDGRLVTVHEVAHQWFYGMVGDSQARDPWLDEAFATYAEQLVDGGPDAGNLDMPGRVGGSMQDFRDNAGGYYATVYGKGSAALAAARQAAGARPFDAALRCYVNANAWKIARPADLERALAGLPKALAVLRKAGALR